jgi:hypothetical protein
MRYVALLLRWVRKLYYQTTYLEVMEEGSFQGQADLVSFTWSLQGPFETVRFRTSFPPFMLLTSLSLHLFLLQFPLYPHFM